MWKLIRDGILCLARYVWEIIVGFITLAIMFAVVMGLFKLLDLWLEWLV